MAREYLVTPWEVRGKVDYGKLIKEFGISLIDEGLEQRLGRYLGDNFFLRRKIFFCHRDLDWVLDEYERGNKFYLYTGRGPSGHTHLGHLIPWIFTKQLQDSFKAKLLFQITDDEKFLFNPELSLDEVKRFAQENILDIIACGFDPKLTQIFSDLEYSKTLYKQAIRVARHLTFSTIKATFGFDSSANAGKIFFTAMQAVPAFLESLKEGKNIPCLIPHAIDQDAHFRIARDVLPKLGYPKPASIQCKFFPGLGKGGKMSASEPETCIFTTDTPEQAEKKIFDAFTGGGATIEEQRKKGGNPEVCSVYQYFYFLFEERDEKLKEIERGCRRGKIICGDCKEILSKRVKAFLKRHQRERRRGRKRIREFLVRD
jgi:tryptophanyl-tRNA synthetase